MRSLIYVLGGAPATDERNFKRLRASRAELEPGIELSEFKRLVREQFFILKLDREQALNSLPILLKGNSNDDIDGYISHLEHVFAASGELSEHAANRFVQVKALFDQARPSKKEASATPNAAKAKTPDVVKSEGASQTKANTEEAKPKAAKLTSVKPSAASEKTEEKATKPSATADESTKSTVKSDSANGGSKPSDKR